LVRLFEWTPAQFARVGELVDIVADVPELTERGD
jgi:hypothetical protein